jgi:hypothetical protein
MPGKKKDEHQARVPTGTVFIPLLVGLFLGFMCVVTGGFLFHPLYNVAAPVVCKGEMQIKPVQYTPDEGGVGYSNQITCVEGGKRTDVSTSASVVAGLIYSAIFVAILIPLWFKYAKPVSGGTSP